MKKTWGITVCLLYLFAVTSASVLRGIQVRNEEGEICLTPECVVAAANIIKAMDQSVDPCDDFFKFACGGWIRKNPIPESKSRWSQLHLLEDGIMDILNDILRKETSDDDPIPVNSARDMYRACMNTERLEETGLKPLTDLLGQFEGWPMTQPNWSGDFSWQDAVAAARRFFGLSYFINMYVGLDASNTEHSTIYVDQGPLGLFRSILVNPAANQNIINSYKTFIKSTAKAVRDSLGNTGVTDKRISAEVEDLLAFEFKLAKISRPQGDSRIKSRLYNPLLLTELQELTDSVKTTSDYSKINWLRYFDNIFEGVPDTAINPEERIIAVETNYLRELVALLDRTPLRTIANYIHWRFVLDLGTETNQLMTDLAFDFSKAVFGTSQQEHRSKKCISKINNFLGFAVSAKYVEKAFNETAKQDVESMIEGLLGAFKELVDEAEWMDDTAKEVALEKADAIQMLVAYPDWIKDRTALESYYEELQIDANDHFGNIQNVNSFLVVHGLKRLRQLTDRTRWTTVPSVLNALYIHEYNTITFPAAVLQPPLFIKGGLNAINYGGIGFVIAHEITHGFGEQGSQKDKNGNTVSWWSWDTLTRYRARVKCFVEQYSNYTIPELSGTQTPNLNGVNTQAENIADNGGIREAYRAYMNYVAANEPEPRLPGLEQYTPEQIFFISYANNWCGTETLKRLQDDIRTDPHSPNRFRVIGPLSNSEDFVTSFNCPAGSKMNRKNKCILW